jgi:hypothetical protein
MTRIKFKSLPIEKRSPLVTLCGLTTFRKVPDPTPESYRRYLLRSIIKLICCDLGKAYLY